MRIEPLFGVRRQHRRGAREPIGGVAESASQKSLRARALVLGPRRGLISARSRGGFARCVAIFRRGVRVDVFRARSVGRVVPGRGGDIARPLGLGRGDRSASRFVRDRVGDERASRALEGFANVLVRDGFGEVVGERAVAALPSVHRARGGSRGGRRALGRIRRDSGRKAFFARISARRGPKRLLASPEKAISAPNAKGDLWTEIAARRPSAPYRATRSTPVLRVPRPPATPHSPATPRPPASTPAWLCA